MATWSSCLHIALPVPSFLAAMMRTDRVLAAWIRARRALSMSPGQLAMRRASMWRKLQPVIALTPARARYAGRDLAEFPVTEIADLRADYGAWNSLDMSDGELRELAAAAEQDTAVGELSAGWSTGTGGGARGSFSPAPQNVPTTSARAWPDCYRRVPCSSASGSPCICAPVMRFTAMWGEGGLRLHISPSKRRLNRALRAWRNSRRRS